MLSLYPTLLRAAVPLLSLPYPHAGDNNYERAPLG
jgi:hypothetical protein